MTTYRTVWLGACGLLTATGLAAALTWPVPRVLAVFAVCSFLAAALRLQYNVSMHGPDELPPFGRLMHKVVRHGVAGGAFALVFFGLAGMASGWLLGLCLLVVALSPRTVRVALSHLRGGSQPLALPTAAAALSDTELCEAWRESSRVLEATTSPAARARVVGMRQVYLRELELRGSGAVAAWLFVGAVPSDDVDQLLGAGSPARDTSIDWDLLLGEDGT